MSAPQGRSRRKLADEEDEVVSMVGQRVWFVDQIEPVGTIRETIPQGGGRVVGFIIEEDKTGIVRKVQRSRVRKYGERYFLVTSWFARADQAAKELEKQLSKGMAPDRDLRYWQQFTERLGQDTLRTHLTRVAPPTYGVAGQLATAAESLSQDLARASVGFRRVQRALVANQAVMSPEEYAQFVDEARKWSRTVRLVLMSVEFMARSLPRAQIDVRNPDAPLPALPVYIPFESLLEAHTPSGEGKARERPAGPTVEAVDEGEFAEVFAEEAEGEWQEAEDFEAASGVGEFAPIKPLKEYEAEGIEEVANPQAAVEAFEEVAPEAPVETFEEVEAHSASPVEEVPVFEEAKGEVAPAARPTPPPPPARAGAQPRAGRLASAAAPAPPPKAAASKAATVEALPEEEEETSFAASRAPKDGRPGQWLTPPSPPPPKAAQVRQAERQERSKDLTDLDAIIAASLGRTPKKAPSKASQGEIAAGGEAPKAGRDALSRDLASLLEKSKKR